MLYNCTLPCPGYFLDQNGLYSSVPHEQILQFPKLWGKPLISALGSSLPHHFIWAFFLTLIIFYLGFWFSLDTFYYLHDLIINILKNWFILIFSKCLIWIFEQFIKTYQISSFYIPQYPLDLGAYNLFWPIFYRKLYVKLSLWGILEQMRILHSFFPFPLLWQSTELCISNGLVVSW